MRVGAANVFDGTLQDAVEAWGAGTLTDEVAFPLADDGNVRGYALVRFVGAEQELAFRRGAGGVVEEDDAADDDLEAEAAAREAKRTARKAAAADKAAEDGIDPIQAAIERAKARKAEQGHDSEKEPAE